MFISVFSVNWSCDKCIFRGFEILLTIMAMALQKVKGNLESMFDKNLADLLRGIRNNKVICLGLLASSNKIGL